MKFSIGGIFALTALIALSVWAMTYPSIVALFVVDSATFFYIMFATIAALVLRGESQAFWIGAATPVWIHNYFYQLRRFFSAVYSPSIGMIRQKCEKS